MRTQNDFGFLDAAPLAVTPLVRGRTVLSPEQRRRKRIGNLVFAIGFSLTLIAWFSLLRPTRLGGTASFVMVQGVSMNPAYHTGDLVITHVQGSYAVGDVIAYKIPGPDVGAGLTVIHRIIGGSATSGFTTQGDNNPTPDDWRPRPADIEGKAWFEVPGGGKILAFLHAPIPLAGLAAAGVVMWVVYQEETPSLRRRRAPEPSNEPEPNEPPEPAISASDLYP